MRARLPDADGFVARDGVKVFYEVFGDGEPTLLLVPAWSITHSRAWKAQVPYLARHHRVVTFDPRGNGRSDRPRERAAYDRAEYAADALAVLDATATERAVLVALSLGADTTIRVAAGHPDRALGAVIFGMALPFLSPPPASRTEYPFDALLDHDGGWAKFNRHYWLRDYAGFVEFFGGRVFSEPHSTKQLEDFMGWGLETDAETLVLTMKGGGFRDRAEVEDTCQRVRCPVLVVHGDGDEVRALETAYRAAALMRASDVTVAGGGHDTPGRDPVLANRLIRRFVDHIHPRPTSTTWTRALRRPKRALYLSSPIGLGHARRDVAIAEELRAVHPDLEIDWLAQHPVTAVLEARGERVHPASRWLACESAHIETECVEHDLHAFQAIRRMDEILSANFMVFQDVVEDGHYDLVVGDEAWDVDYFLHENPELKRFAFAWMTDFVGWLPMPDGGPREAAITADHNAEMIEQRARFRRVRDRSVFVGDPADVVPDRFGPGLPFIREWTEANFDFAGYITGFDPAALADTSTLRAELGYRADEKVCVVTVGGSGVGGSLLRKVIAAYPAAKRLEPALRMVVVAGPRIDPASLPTAEGVEIRALVPALHRHLAACDLAVVQGGLTTCMELTATSRPFLYFPLAHHFEQTFHVRHRLDRYRAGRCMDYATETPDTIAAAIAHEVGRPVDYEPVAAGGAGRAARLIAELL